MSRITATKTKVGMNSQDAKMPGYRIGKTKDGRDYISVNVNAVDENNNRINFESFGMVSSSIKTFNTDGEQIEIAWDDRTDPEVIKKCRNTNVISFGGNRMEFISSYDMNQFIIDHFEEMKDNPMTITGTIAKDFYNGNVRNRFQIQNMYESKDDPNIKSNIRMTAEFFWNSESIDVNDFADEKKIYINGYTSEYVGAVKEKRYVPCQLVLDCNKLDFTNELHVKQLRFKLKMLGCEYTDGKIKCKYKNKKYHSVSVIANYINSAEKLEFTVDMLTDTQREQYELGMKTLDQLRPIGQVYGNRVQCFKLVNYDLRGKYEDGSVELDETPEEFEALVYVGEKQETVQDLEEKAKENDSKEEAEQLAAELEDMFS